MASSPELFFLPAKPISLFTYLGLVTIFTIYKLHPFYNDYKVIESSQYHQGLKIEKNFEDKRTHVNNQLEKYFDKLVDNKKLYANKIGAEFKLLEPKSDLFDNMNLKSIRKDWHEEN